MPEVWRYVVRYDRGFAPHISDNLLTLCTCKPMIRKYAKIGDYVLGFNKIRYDPGSLIWAGRVSEKLLMGDYAIRFPSRRDVIYHRTGWEIDGREKLIHYGGQEHNDTKSIQTDISGEYSLLCKSFWFWGRNAVVLPDALHALIYKNIGQKKKIPNQGLLIMLEKWLEEQSSGINGEHRDVTVPLIVIPKNDTQMIGPDQQIVPHEKAPNATKVGKC
jgi:hypothetical protein